MKFVISDKDRFDISCINLLSCEEAELLLTPEQKVLGEMWWLGSSVADHSAGVVDRKGQISSASVAFADFGVRPALRFMSNINARVGDKIEIGGETWTVVVTSAVADSVALCDRIVGHTRYCNDLSVSNDFESSDIKSWLDTWAWERGFASNQTLEMLSMR